MLRVVADERTSAELASRAAGLAMAYKLIEAAQDRWRSVNVALVRAGAVFHNGVLVERAGKEAAA